MPNRKGAIHMNKMEDLLGAARFSELLRKRERENEKSKLLWVLAIIGAIAAVAAIAYAVYRFFTPNYLEDFEEDFDEDFDDDFFDEEDSVEE